MVDTSQPVEYHALFPETPYKVAFREASIRDDFNRGLKEIRENGLYDRTIKKYVQ